MVRRHAPRPRPVDTYTAEDFTYIEFIQGRVSALTEQFQRHGRNPTQLEAGDSLLEAIQKWLIRESQHQPDKALTYNAAMEYRDFLRAQKKGSRKYNQEIARLARKRDPDTAVIEEILKATPEMPAKEIEREAAKLGRRLREEGLKNRISRVRTELREKAENEARMTQWDADDESPEGKSH